MNIFSAEYIGRCLQTKRKQKKITQDVICEKCNRSKTYISNIERGKASASVEILMGYCDVLDMTPNELLNISPESQMILPELAKALAELPTEKQKQILRIIYVL